MASISWDTKWTSTKKPANEMRWIPVTERLPEEGTNVVVTYKYHGTLFFGVGWSHYGTPEGAAEPRFADFERPEYEEYFEPDEVLAWMPMIEPYIPKEEK